MFMGLWGRRGPEEVRRQLRQHARAVGPTYGWYPWEHGAPLAEDQNERVENQGGQDTLIGFNLWEQEFKSAEAIGYRLSEVSIHITSFIDSTRIKALAELASRDEVSRIHAEIGLTDLPALLGHLSSTQEAEKLFLKINPWFYTDNYRDYFSHPDWIGLSRDKKVKLALIASRFEFSENFLWTGELVFRILHEAGCRNFPERLVIYEITDIDWYAQDLQLSKRPGLRRTALLLAEGKKLSTDSLMKLMREGIGEQYTLSSYDFSEIKLPPFFKPLSFPCLEWCFLLGKPELLEVVKMHPPRWVKLCKSTQDFLDLVEIAKTSTYRLDFLRKAFRWHQEKESFLSNGGHRDHLNAWLENPDLKIVFPDYKRIEEGSRIWAIECFDSHYCDSQGRFRTPGEAKDAISVPADVPAAAAGSAVKKGRGALSARAAQIELTQVRASGAPAPGLFADGSEEFKGREGGSCSLVSLTQRTALLSPPALA